MKIVILERNSIGLDIPMDVYEKHGDVEYFANTVTNEEVKERIKDADAVIANKAPLNAENLSGAKNVRFIGELATGFDNIDIGYCREKGIRVIRPRWSHSIPLRWHSLFCRSFFITINT